MKAIGGKFFVRRTVFNGKVNFFVDHTKFDGEDKGYTEAVCMWKGKYTPHKHVSPKRTILNKLFGLTFEQECRNANATIKAWCDWANDIVEKREECNRELEVIVQQMWWGLE